jgi:hypothetical protein
MNTKPCPSCGEEIDDDCDICEDCANEDYEGDEDEEEE